MNRKSLKIRVETVRRARILAGLTQADLAKKAGVSEQAVNRLSVSGHCGIRTARSIAAALKIKLADIVIFDEPEIERTPQAVVA